MDLTKMKKKGKVFIIFNKEANKRPTESCTSEVEFPIGTTKEEALKIKDEKYQDYPLFEYNLFETEDGKKIALNERRVK